MWCDFCIASAVKDVTPLCVGLPPSRSAERRALHLSAGAGNVLSNVFSRGYSRCVTHGPGVLWSGSRYGRLHKHNSVRVVSNALDQKKKQFCHFLTVTWISSLLWLCWHFVFLISSAAGARVGQSAVRSVSQHCANDRDKSPTEAHSTCPLPGVVQPFQTLILKLQVCFLPD